MADILYKDLSFAVVGAAMEVHSILGPGFLEESFSGCAWPGNDSPQNIIHVTKEVACHVLRFTGWRYCCRFCHLEQEHR